MPCGPPVCKTQYAQHHENNWRATYPCPTAIPTPSEASWIMSTSVIPCTHYTLLPIQRGVDAVGNVKYAHMQAQVSLFDKDRMEVLASSGTHLIFGKSYFLPRSFQLHPYRHGLL